MAGALTGTRVQNNCRLYPCKRHSAIKDRGGDADRWRSYRDNSPCPTTSRNARQRRAVFVISNIDDLATKCQVANEIFTPGREGGVKFGE